MRGGDLDGPRPGGREPSRSLHVHFPLHRFQLQLNTFCNSRQHISHILESRDRLCALALLRLDRLEKRRVLALNLVENERGEEGSLAGAPRSVARRHSPLQVPL